MKTYFQRTSLLTLLLLHAGLNAEPVESFKLETHAYVFKNSDFQAVQIPASTTANQSRAVAFRSPATAQFDRETLSLEGRQFSWNGGQNTPGQFKPITIPVVSVTPEHPVSLLSVVPVQYLEKDATGALQVREIPSDSPEAPHWRLTFTLKTRERKGDDLSLICEVDVASVSARESLPGVTLAVGKPVIARFNEKLDLKVVPEEWSAFVVRAPNESNYSLLTLVKIAPEPKPAATAATAKSGGPMTAQEFAEFATYYYLHPQPEMIARAIESLGPNGFLDDRGDQYDRSFLQRANTCVGFFAEIFAANPDRVADWRKVIERRGQDRQVRVWLREALKLSQSGSLLDRERDGPHSWEDTNRFFGAFFASSNPLYLRKLVDRLESVDGSSKSLYRAAIEAVMLFAYNGPHHPIVRETLQAAREQASPRTRELIDDVLTKNVAALQKEFRVEHAEVPSSNSTANDSNLNPWGIPVPPPPPLW